MAREYRGYDATRIANASRKGALGSSPGRKTRSGNVGRPPPHQRCRRTTLWLSRWRRDNAAWGTRLVLAPLPDQDFWFSCRSPNMTSRKGGHAHHSGIAMGCRVGSPSKNFLQRPHWRFGVTTTTSLSTLGGASGDFADTLAPRLGRSRRQACTGRSAQRPSCPNEAALPGPLQSTGRLLRPARDRSCSVSGVAEAASVITRRRLGGGYGSGHGHSHRSISEPTEPGRSAP